MVCSGALVGGGTAEHRVVPEDARLRDPLRRPVLAGVFDDDAQTALAGGVIGGSQYPHARLIHFHDGIDALARSQGQHLDRLRVRDRIAIQGQHMELMAGQGDGAVLHGAGVQQMHQHAAARPHADRFSGPQRLVVDRVELAHDFKPVRAGVQLCRLLGLRSRRVLVVHVHELIGIEMFPVAQREKHLLVIGARIAA